MDFVRPTQAVIPGAQGKILAVMAQTTGELSVRTIARLAGVSPAQASRILPSLVELGMLRRRDVPPTALFRFVPENVASRAVLALTRVRRTTLEDLGSLAAELTPSPVSVITFGSFARGQALPSSDVDIIIVRSDAVGAENPTWRDGLETFRQAIADVTGNDVEILEIARADAQQALCGELPLWQDVRRDAIVVFGAGIAELSRVPASA